MSARLDCELHDRVAILTIVNPEKRNALDPDLLEQMSAAFERLADQDARAVVLRGDGNRIFSSGYDIGAIRGGDGEEASRHPLGRALAAVERHPYPVLAMVFGGAYGAACELLSACDLRFAANNARFAIPAAKLGVVYAADGIARLVRQASVGLVRELLLTARPMEAERAQALGLLHGLYSYDELETSVLALANEISNLAPRTLRATKEMLAALGKRTEFDPLDLPRLDRLRDEALSSEDFAEGQRAFAEKRPPRFSGK